MSSRACLRPLVAGWRAEDELAFRFARLGSIGMPELQAGQEVTHRLWGWRGRLSHREGQRWSVVWAASDLFSGWTFSLQEEADLGPVNHLDQQLKLFQRNPDYK